MLNKVHFLILILSLSLISACTTSRASSENNEEVVIEGNNGGQNKDEIVITDADLNGLSPQNSPDGTNTQELIVAGEDKSKVTTMIDTYGNKTEKRCWVNHSRLDCIVIQTSAGGKKEILLYPVGSGAKILPENNVEQALTATADELANLAGVTSTRTEVAKRPISPYGTNADKNSLRPLSSSEFQIFPKQISPPAIDQTGEGTEDDARFSQAESTTSKPEN